MIRFGTLPSKVCNQVRVNENMETYIHVILRDATMIIIHNDCNTSNDSL